MTAVRYSYDFIVPSYRWAILRFEAAVTRIERLMMFAATMTLAAFLIGPTLHTGLRFSSQWSMMTVVLFMTLLILGLMASGYGTLMVDSAGVLQEKTLDLDEVEFKHYAVYYARQDLEHNRHLIQMKSLCGTIMAILLVAELLAIVAWFFSAAPGLADVAN